MVPVQLVALVVGEILPELAVRQRPDSHPLIQERFPGIEITHATTEVFYQIFLGRTFKEAVFPANAKLPIFLGCGRRHLHLVGKQDHQEGHAAALELLGEPAHALCGLPDRLRVLGRKQLRGLPALVSLASGGQYQPDLRADQ